MATVADVVVVGGGISGTAAAYELARAGAAVTLVEQGDLASMASGWTLGGVRQSGRDLAELPLAQAAVRRWMELGDELAADLEYRQDGNLRLARTPEEAPVIRRLVEEQRRAGLALELVDGRALRALAPALSPEIVCASHCPTDGHANPTAAVRAFAAAAQRHGAVIRTHTRVTGIDARGGRVRAVETTGGTIAAESAVLAAGVYTDRLCRPLGLALPLTTAHVAVVQTVPLPPVIRQVLGVANGDFAGRQEVGGRLRMTGDAFEWRWPERALAPDDVQPPARAVAAVLSRAAAVLPAVAGAGIARIWGGLIDRTPDALPVIERTPEIEGLIIAAGFSGHGFCLGPMTGRLVCELVTRRETSLPLWTFRRARFDGAALTPPAKAADLYG
jgi:sarcosine oxidase subunit beta